LSDDDAGGRTTKLQNEFVARASRRASSSAALFFSENRLGAKAEVACTPWHDAQTVATRLVTALEKADRRQFGRICNHTTFDRGPLQARRWGAIA
jgi:hypothetical protein